MLQTVSSIAILWSLETGVSPVSLSLSLSLWLFSLCGPPSSSSLIWEQSRADPNSWIPHPPPPKPLFGGLRLAKYYSPLCCCPLPTFFSVLSINTKHIQPCTWGFSAAVFSRGCPVAAPGDVTCWHKWCSPVYSTLPLWWKNRRSPQLSDPAQRAALYINPQPHMSSAWDKGKEGCKRRRML